MHWNLRLLDTYAIKVAKICDPKTFWPLIQLINHLFKIRQKANFCYFLKHRCLVTLRIPPLETFTALVYEKMLLSHGRL